MTASKSKIEWTESVWNPIRGCSLESEGCRNCYAMRQAWRFSGPGQPYEGLVKKINGRPVWTGEVRLVEKDLEVPLRWRKPRRVFVNSMSDLFHPSVPDAWIDRIFAVMALTPHHTYQVLTKRAGRMRKYLTTSMQGAAIDAADPNGIGGIYYNPLPNVWLGVSVEDQATADERIPALLDTPAAIRWVSYEPALGPVDFTRLVAHAKGGLDALRPGPQRLDWIVMGGESGPDARPFNLHWARNTIADCKAAGVACFVKQLGANPIDPWADTGALVNDREPAQPKFRHSKGGDMAEWPADLRVREMPRHLTE